MKPADYTLPIYKQQLAQHVWDWDQRVAWPPTRRMYSEAEENLKQIAHERGGEFLEAFNQHSPQTIFPFAGIPASEIQDNKIPNPNTPMKIEINIPDELFNPLVQAIDRLTAAVTAGGINVPTCTVTGTVTGTTSPQCGPTVTATVTEPTPEPEKPKAGRPKKDKPAPELEPISTTAIEAAFEAAPAAEPTPEPAPAESPAKVKVPTGPELSEKVKPLAAHPELQQDLIRYKTNELKVNAPIRLTTDTDILAKFDAKVDELLAKIPAEV